MLCNPEEKEQQQIGEMQFFEICSIFEFLTSGLVIIYRASL